MIKKVAGVTHWLSRQGLWRLIAWGVGGLALADGATYFVKGNSASSGPSFYVLKTIPLGLHTYGAIMMLFAILIYYSSAAGGEFARRVQFATFILGIWVSVAVIVSWIQAQQVAFGAVSKWFFITWVALSLSLTVTERRPSNEE